jgi:hypothetical protein
MGTLLDLGSSALTQIGQLGSGQTATPEDGAQILRQANLILSAKSTQRLFLQYVATREFVLTPGLADYTLGPVAGATFVAPRPTFIESAQAKIPGTNSWFPINILDKAHWDGIVGKGATDEKPSSLYPEYTFPNMAFHVNPIPTGGAGLRLGAWEQLTQFASLFDIIALPLAYEAWLEVKLATVLSVFYDQPLPQALMMRMQETEADLQKYNAQGLGGALTAAQRLEAPNLGQPIPSGGGAPPQAGQ